MSLRTKLFFIVKNYKVLEYRNGVAYTINIKTKEFVFWICDKHSFPIILEVCNSPLLAKFKFDILMRV